MQRQVGIWRLVLMAFLFIGVTLDTDIVVFGLHFGTLGPFWPLGGPSEQERPLGTQSYILMIFA